MNLGLLLMRILDTFATHNLIAMHIQASVFKKRKGFWLRAILHGLPMIVIWDLTKQAYPVAVFSNPIIDKMLMVLPLLYTFLGCLLCYECEFTEAVFCTSCAEIVVNITCNLWYLPKMYLRLTDGSAISLAWSGSILLLLCIPFYLTTMRKVNGVKWSPFVRKQMFMIYVLFLLLQTFFNNRVTGALWEETVYITYVIADIAFLIVQIGFSRESVLEQKYAMIEELLHSEQKKQQITSENIELINRKCHDLKHQIAGLKRMSSESERNEYIREIENAVMFYESAIKTGNETLDLILMEKLLYCQAHDIKLTCIADGRKLDHLDTMDLYTLFGNAVDNAIESVSQEPDPSQRMISLRISTWGDHLIIHMENYLGKELTLSDGLPLTTKNDTRYHGFGVLSIRHIVEKYKGSMTIRTEDHLFQLDILIPIS